MVRFFNLVEENDTIGAPPHCLAQLAAFFIADITGWRANEAGHAVFLHILAHVDADHGVLIIEEKFCQRSSQLGFAHAGRAKKDE